MITFRNHVNNESRNHLLGREKRLRQIRRRSVLPRFDNIEYAFLSATAATDINTLNCMRRNTSIMKRILHHDLVFACYSPFLDDAATISEHVHRQQKDEYLHSDNSSLTTRDIISRLPPINPFSIAYVRELFKWFLLMPIFFATSNAT